MTAPKRTVEPLYQPVTLAQARLQCRIDADNTSEDALLTGVIIPGAVDVCEQLTRRSLMLQTWRLTLDAFANEMPLSWPNVLSVTSVAYRDTAGAWQTLDSGVYEVDTDLACVRLASGQSWPSLYSGGGVRITYTAGYASGNEAAQQAAVPAGIKEWLLLTIGSAYAQRESLAAGVAVAELPGRFVDGMLDRFKVYGC